MKRPWLAAGLCLVVVGLGAIGVRHESRAELQRALASLRANLPPDARFEYDHAYPRFFARGAGFENARFIKGSTVLTARLLMINNPQGYLSTGLSVSRIHAENVTLRGDVTGQIENLTINRLLLPPIRRENHDVTGLPPASMIHFRHGQLHDVDIDKLSAGCHLHIGEASLDNYGHDDGNNSAWHDVSLFCPAHSMASLAIGSAIRQDIGALSFSLKDNHMTGFRLARLIGWGEVRISGKEMPLVRIQPLLWEDKSSGDLEEMAISAMNIQIRTQAASMKQWQDGDLTRIEDETKKISIANLPPPADRFLPRGVTIADLHQSRTLNRKSGQDTVGLKASTPGLFVYSMQMEGKHFQPRTPQEKPELAHLILSYEDRGNTIDALMQRVADFRHISLDELKAAMLTPLAMIAQTAPGLSALPGFLENPQGHRITLTFTPPHSLVIAPDSFAGLATTMKTSAAARQLWLSPPVLTTSLQ